jgi:hypothetical protein
MTTAYILTGLGFILVTLVYFGLFLKHLRLAPLALVGVPHPPNEISEAPAQHAGHQQA